MCELFWAQPLILEFLTFTALQKTKQRFPLSEYRPIFGSFFVKFHVEISQKVIFLEFYF
jgi:hypothetical protein